MPSSQPTERPDTGPTNGFPRPRSRGWAWSVVSYALIALLSGIAWVCLFGLNRTRVHRPKRRPPPSRNTMFVSNHQSSADTLLVGLAVWHPQSWLEPRLLPWSLAAAEVFFRTPITTWFARHLRCLPVRRDRRDPAALRGMLRALAGGTAIYFPEGRRSRSGALGEASPAAGWLALASRARVIPVAIDGMNEVVRFDRFGLRIFRSIGVSVGAELDLSAFRDREPSRAVAREVTALMMAAIQRELAHARIARGVRSELERSPT